MVITRRQAQVNNNEAISSNGVTQNGYHDSKTISDDKMSPHWKNSWLSNFFHCTVWPFILILGSSQGIMLLWYTAKKCDGSFSTLGGMFTTKGVLGVLVDIWSSVNICTKFSVLVLLSFFSFQLVLMRFLPGKTVYGPLTPNGHRPVYKDNGFYCYIVSVSALFILQYFLKQYSLSVTIVYDRFEEFLATLSIFSGVFCIFLYIKGRVAPSPGEWEVTGNFIFDYFCGIELYPRIFGFDVKVFTNCRFGMTVWPLLICIHAMKSYELYGFVDSMFVSATLQMMYMTKFFWWESGYMGTLDIMMDRAGYYICWGCLVFIPGLYAITTFYLVSHPVRLGFGLSIAIFTVGSLALVLNYWADWQKQYVRAKNGDCLLWGKPPQMIKAKYHLKTGEVKESLLLASGFWGVSRHFHYLPELLHAFCWCLPSMFQNIMAYTYFIWLLMLLVHRTYRDDLKCSVKYGEHWKEYKELVPYKIIPYVF
ncbi:7-dehydrocholesterol reductase [Lingula anatina]|uniref:7-dehydrocholesterol reductase n=1 Tax=Lingula anatina TaxID=7574 RepID=A0A1S3J0H7_LINAN|nr:7-dehydrocholesterol reductase [Lingula anatina]XP_013403764.1 7-dehydrocholesterol reductase [Lingula anatina]|eukprot:XP_013403763.1 7-dehydrocholesterol reductase [Lingula anatina]